MPWQSQPQRLPGIKPRTKVRKLFVFPTLSVVEEKVLRPCPLIPCCICVSRTLSFRLDTCCDGLTRAWLVCAFCRICDDPAGPSLCYSMPCCFLSCSKLSLRASRSSFDRSIFSGWWYSTTAILEAVADGRMGKTYQRDIDFGS